MIDLQKPLFRYRKIDNDYTLDALAKNEVWATSPIEFNDPYDSNFIHSEEDAIPLLTKIITEDDIIKISNAYNCCPTKSACIQEFFKGLQTVMQQTRRGQYIACFSEDVTNQAMWAHYATNGQGFAIEYVYGDFMLDVGGNGIYYYPRKMKYSNDLYNYKSYLKEIEANYNDFKLGKERVNLDFTFLPKIFTKQKFWSYEKEWRIMYRSINNFAGMPIHKCLAKIPPKAIYLGEYMNAENSLKIQRIYDELKRDNKHIKLFKMKSYMRKGEYGLEPILI